MSQRGVERKHIMTEGERRDKIKRDKDGEEPVQHPLSSAWLCVSVCASVCT